MVIFYLMEILEDSNFPLTVYFFFFFFQMKGVLWPGFGNTCQGQSWWWEVEINLVCHLQGLHAEYELTESCGLTQAQGPVPDTNNWTGLGFLGGRLHPSVAVEIVAGTEWFHPGFSSSLLTSRVPQLNSELFPLLCFCLSLRQILSLNDLINLPGKQKFTSCTEKLLKEILTVVTTCKNNKSEPNCKCWESFYKTL